MSRNRRPNDPRPQPPSNRHGEGGPRRSILLGLPLLFFLPASWAGHVSGPSLLDPDERMRLRRELRQAHRERMRSAGATGGTSEPAPSLPPHHEPGRAVLGPSPVHPPEASWPRRRADGSLPPHESGGSPPGRFMLTDEEREQLRRQLREQRAARRAAQPSQTPNRGPMEP